MRKVILSVLVLMATSTSFAGGVGGNVECEATERYVYDVKAEIPEYTRKIMGNLSEDNPFIEIYSQTYCNVEPTAISFKWDVTKLAKISDSLVNYYVILTGPNKVTGATEVETIFVPAGKSSFRSSSIGDLVNLKDQLTVSIVPMEATPGISLMVQSFYINLKK